MDRRAFLKTVVAAGGVTLYVSKADAMRFYPKTGQQKWGVLYGSRYGSTRDAAFWISEGMGGIAEVVDARENPDLSKFESVIVGSGIYSGKIDNNLESYLSKSAQFSSHIKALFIVCGGGDTPRAQAFVDQLAKACGLAKPPALVKVFPGRLTIRLLTPADDKIEEEVAKKFKQPYEDYDRLQRKDCLKFGEEVVAKK
jgi:menaquinone-dependent protoporphyrinogen IX oxidase